eukprot:6057540-Heterocapsa_arctica.AAC.1
MATIPITLGAGSAAAGLGRADGAASSAGSQASQRHSAPALGLPSGRWKPAAQAPHRCLFQSAARQRLGIG